MRNGGPRQHRSREGRTCGHVGCETLVHCHDLCKAHYMRLYRRVLQNERRQRQRTRRYR